VKNHFASEFIYHKYKDMKTCGVIEHDDAAGISKVAEPVGVVAGVVPTTNPTSTAIFKSLLALKTRNALVLSPHPRAAKVNSLSKHRQKLARVFPRDVPVSVNCIDHTTNHLLYIVCHFIYVLAPHAVHH
jgi:acyl-CoA reductase-like NAD-dependent aldehyde dehydrogenase